MLHKHRDVISDAEKEMYFFRVIKTGSNSVVLNAKIISGFIQFFQIIAFPAMAC